MDPDEELGELQAVACRACGHDYPAHEDGGGRCGAPVAGLLNPRAFAVCECPGFRWVPAEGPSPTYGG